MNNRQSGFSTIELIVVVAIIAILSVFALISFTAPKKYNPDNQAVKLTDLFQDARQKALVENAVMRVEIDKTKQELHLIDENVAGDAADDVMVRKIPFESTTSVVIDAHPKNVSTTTMPTASSPIPESAYAISKHPLSLGDQVMAFRFQKDGTVTDAGTTAIGTGSIVTGATIFIYDTPDSAGYAKIIRAVTLVSYTAASDIVKCQMSAANVCTAWVK